MTKLYVYARINRGKIHLVDGGPMAKRTRLSICGKPMPAHAISDEHTTSGERATCGVCRTVLAADVRRAQPARQLATYRHAELRSCGCPAGTDYRVLDRATGERAQEGERGAMMVCADCGKETGP